MVLFEAEREKEKGEFWRETLRVPGTRTNTEAVKLVGKM